MKRGLLVKRVVVGIFALAVWLLFFSSGLLLETVEYRRFLAPHSFAKQAEADAKVGNVATPYTGSPAFAFFAATLFFTPTNLAFLTLLAALLGGCASNIVAENLDEDHVKQIDSRRLMYLEEMPWSAMMRGFIVYLCVIAGLYFAMDDPFKDSTPAQYMRLAGTLSLLAFVVGYDPSRIEQWLRLVPSPPPSQRITVREGRDGVELRAEQGPIATPERIGEMEQPAAVAVVTSIAGNGERSEGPLTRVRPGKQHPK